MKKLFLVMLAGLSLSACGSWYGEEEDKLPGERISIRDVSASSETTNFVTGQPLPASVINQDWLAQNVTASHEGFHLTLPPTVKQAWRTDVGDVSGKDSIATTPPVASEDTLYFLNAEGEVVAVSLSDGDARWVIDITPEGEDADNGFGGGLALANGRLFVSTGFGEVIAVSPETGDVQWRSRTSAPVRSAPTVYKGKVIVVARDNTAVAFDVNSGNTVWEVIGAATGAAFLGGASPAAAGQIVVLPFASGEIVAVDVDTGRRGWAQVLSGGQRGAALGAINDISSDPVLHKGNVFVANQSGQLNAYQAGTGRSLWTRRLGAYNASWVAGDSLYMITSNARLVRLLTKTGESVWETALPLYADEDDKEDVITYGGPIVASNRIYFTSSKDGLMVYDANTGEPIQTDLLDEEARIPPVVVQQTLYVIADDGNLYAFR